MDLVSQVAIRTEYVMGLFAVKFNYRSADNEFSPRRADI